MSNTTFTGPNLSNKRKEELVTIAYALGLPNVDGALRDGLIKSIKTHLTDNRDVLSVDPRFSGLYPATRTRRAVARLTLEGGEEEEEESEPTTLNGRTVEAAIDRAEAKEAAESVVESGEVVVTTSTLSVVIAKPSALASFDWKTTPLEWLEAVRELLSDEELIAGVTLVVEMLWFLSAVLPIHYHPLTIPAFLRTAPPAGGKPVVVSRTTTIAFPVPQPTLATFQAVFTWALPSLIIPLIAGSLISLARPRKQLDPITVSIVRLACVWAQGSIGGVPVNARIAGALISLLFAFASAIYEAPSSASSTTIVV
ncbi:hypothetical protein CALVIDRAFT_562959 [Calocera viscosa TUFC12733]|uniref:Uncharacterized protein n=1 Tax=Calocera viscosa (strain TUFC12733) TaxID=1330018 RepID=A0A167NE55_CALVF|nr:hypothetical protein CALVIDRAFT_562959 [Calocera viscosa TUFC12733]